ncbi:O-methyltransferase family 3 protein [Heterostelium album PN500]|uniref:O-methyltransferase family 3 protein n=1 Tax=Heterostelium pallidum (strain ATCC 26659 / Pp 5 / PN500) TaxID=670386 RepID=D3BEC4_HETP5|nr:O-methyltransferase family 3 protein [Heterostelium album PN500]EFA80255.1 O-methyltransferase family 3 protein [Heterostelium album PN500]|eukprot:XP_020432375.1 O-methyltransferase family 3 protein [Heterostelium album PN500]
MPNPLELKTDVSGTVYEYVLQYGTRLNPIQKELVESTMSFTMLTTYDQSQFFQFLVRILNAKNTIDVGVFTGMSSLTVALALPEDGKVIACDVSTEYTQHAKQFWEKAGVSNKIDLIIQPAAQTLQKLIDDGREGTFDFMFIDADKTSYDTYYELGLKLIRKGGVIAFDNVLQHGRVINEAEIAASTDVQAIVALNKKIHTDNRVHISMIPVADVCCKVSNQKRLILSSVVVLLLYLTNNNNN